MIMKTKLWMLGMAVAALTSCTQSEVVEIPESRVIGFDSHVDKTTRAMTPISGVGQADNDLRMFYVYGYENDSLYFNGTTVEYDGSKFTYSPHKQWKAAKNYHFAAYSDGNSICTNVVYNKITGGSQLVISDYTVGDNDLMAAIVDSIPINAGASNTPEHVDLTFEHMLCVITLSLTNGGTNYLQLGDITAKGVKTNTCTYKINNGAKTCNWSTGIPEENAYTFAGTGDNAYIEPAGRHVVSLFFIPQSTDINITIPVRTYTKSGNEYILSTSENKNTTLKLLENGVTSSWQNGKHYVYNGTLAGTVHYIHFDATVSGWGTPVNNTLVFSD